jgi:hypothetical protein
MEKNNNKTKIKQKFYFDLKIDCLLPATITYHVLAENAEEAVKLIKYMAPTSVQYKLHGRKELKLRVYDAGSSIIRFIKNLAGR